MVEDAKYSMEEIRKACKIVFHNTGEWYFDGNKNDWLDPYGDLKEALEGKLL